MEVTREYLESIVSTDNRQNMLLADIIKITDAELVFNTQVHQRIEAFIPLNISKMKDKFRENDLSYLTEDNVFDLRHKITKAYRLKGFYVYFTNHKSNIDVCLTITNSTEV